MVWGDWGAYVLESRASGGGVGVVVLMLRSGLHPVRHLIPPGGEEGHEVPSPVQAGHLPMPAPPQPLMTK